MNLSKNIKTQMENIPLGEKLFLLESYGYGVEDYPLYVCLYTDLEGNKNIDFFTKEETIFDNGKRKLIEFISLDRNKVGGLEAEINANLHNSKQIKTGHYAPLHGVKDLPKGSHGIMGGYYFVYVIDSAVNFQEIRKYLINQGKITSKSSCFQSYEILQYIKENYKRVESQFDKPMVLERKL